MKAINCITFFLLITLKAQTQNVMTSSPYSMFGIGALESGLYGQNAWPVLRGRVNRAV